MIKVLDAITIFYAEFLEQDIDRISFEEHLPIDAITNKDAVMMDEGVGL